MSCDGSYNSTQKTGESPSVRQRGDAAWRDDGREDNNLARGGRMTARKRQQTSSEAQVPDAVDALRLLDATFEAIADAMVVVDETGRIVRSNAAFRAMVGAAENDDFFAAPLAERMQRVQIADALGQPLPPEQW